MPIAPTPPGCWDGRSWLQNRLTFARIPAGCMRLRCAFCAEPNVARVRRAVCRAQPSQLVTITLVGDDWQTIRARMARVRYDCAEMGEPLDWAWVVERNPRGTGHHVHGVRRGGWMQWHVLNAACERRGTGFPWLTPVSARKDPGSYMFKYLSKGVRFEGVESFLGLNGGRLVHTSRGFWLNDYGQPATYREARRGDGTWTLVIEGEPRTRARDARRASEMEAYTRSQEPRLARLRAEVESHAEAVRMAERGFPGARPGRPTFEQLESLAEVARRGGAFAGFRQAQRARRRAREQADPATHRHSVAEYYDGDRPAEV